MFATPALDHCVHMPRQTTGFGTRPHIGPQLKGKQDGFSLIGEYGEAGGDEGGFPVGPTPFQGRVLKDLELHVPVRILSCGSHPTVSLQAEPGHCSLFW